MQLKVKKLFADAIVPEYGHVGDAGMDIFSRIEIIIPPRQRASVPAGISLEFPPEYVALVWDKSGLAQKNGLTNLAGVIDAGFRGELTIITYNTSDEPYTIKKGQKIAQLLFQPIVTAKVTVVDELNDSTRSTGGFGSTGLFKKQ